MAFGLPCYAPRREFQVIKFTPKCPKNLTLGHLTSVTFVKIFCYREQKCVILCNLEHVTNSRWKMKVECFKVKDKITEDRKLNERHF